MAEQRGGRVRGKQRDAIFEQDAFKCCYCLLDLTNQPRLLWTIDHVVPRRDGGTNVDSNLLTSCFYCNSRRGATPIHRFVGRETLLRLIRDYPRVAATIIGVMAEDGAARTG
jgi:5-methylcytosine-specific restriction endonuclease McrA